MERDNIIKALECCIGGQDDKVCIVCPYDNHKCNCVTYLMTDALALITSQEQRIKELEAENEKLTINMNAYGLTAKRLGEENERLEKALIEQSAENVMLCGEVKHARADTVRKMQERFLAYFGTYVLGYKIQITDALKAVNQIAKEMIGEIE